MEHSRTDLLRQIDEVNTNIEAALSGKPVTLEPSQTPPMTRTEQQKQPTSVTGLEYNPGLKTLVLGTKALRDIVF